MLILYFSVGNLITHITIIDQIEKAFLTQSKKVMNENKEELKNSKLQKSKKLKAKKEEDMKKEITEIYEALQYLTEKKNKKQNIKGQIISECLFDLLNFSKKPTKNLTNFCPRI